MKKLLLYIGLFLFITNVHAQLDRSVKPPPGPAPEINIGEYQAFELKNGLKVIVVENHKLPRVSFSLIIDRDPIVEDEKVGYISMAGQMLRRGTENRTKDQIDEEVDFIGASLSTGSNSVFASSLTKHTGKLLELMTDVLYNPVFPDEELEKIKTQTISAIASQQDDPESIAGNVSSVVLYSRDHPYGEIQRKEHVENITRQDLVDYYNTYFRPNISYLAIVGDISPKEAKKLAKEHFSEWEKGDVPEHTYDIPVAPEGNQVALVNRQASVQTVLNLAYPIILEKGHPDVIKASVMNEILGGSSASRLFKNIREEKGYTYGAYSSISSDELVGNFSAGASVRNEVTDSTLTEFITEFERIKNEPVTDDELRRAKNVLAGSFGRSLESPQTVASFAISIQRYNLPEDYYDTYVKKVENVSKSDIQQMAEKYILPGNMHIVAVGKASDIEGKLKKFGEITWYDPYGNIEDPAEKEMPVGLTADIVLENYIKAIGGKEKLKSIENLQMQMSADVMGNVLNMHVTKKTPNKMRMEVKMGGNVMSQQIYNGEEVKMVQMGNEVPVNERIMEQLKIEGYVFPELHYKENQVETKLSGLETIDGRDTYAMEVIYPSGTSSTHYFDAETWYKIREVQQEETPQGQVTMTTDFSDFEATDGIVFPRTFKIPLSPAMKMDAKVESVELNSELDENLFEIE